MGELFSGPGGIAYGAMQAEIQKSGKRYKIKHCWATDYDNDACNTYRASIPDAKESSVICEDIRKLNTKILPSIDGFSFGFPCNDFSNVGEKKGFHGTFGPLYSYGVNVLNEKKPKFFLAENVHGLISSNEGKAFEKILSELKSAGNGYNITAHLYKFEEYGVPQIRHRIIVIGIDKTLEKIFRVPSPITKHDFITCKQAICEPPIPLNAANNELTKQSAVVVERLRHIKPGENAWNSNLPDSLKLNVKGAKLSQIYKRLDPNKPAYTITGSGGGGTHVYHWEEPRALTNRERARLQTFPDSYIFQGSKESVRKQIGMAVPPKASMLIFSSILKTLAGIPYDYIEPSWGYL
jgi:DNA (cytosine-5)-methyltransferase 1